MTTLSRGRDRAGTVPRSAGEPGPAGWRAGPLALGARLRRQQVDAGTVKRLRVEAERLRRWDGPGGARQPHVSDARRAVVGALVVPCPPRLRPDLHAAVGEILHTIGYIAFDSGDLRAARSGYTDTLDIALEAGGPLELSLTHRARISMARAHLTRYRDNSLQPHRAIEWATGADEPRLTPAERALAWQVKARAHATLGNSRATNLAVEMATEHHERAAPEADAPWVSVSGEAEFLGDTGHALAELALANADAAARVVREADSRLLDAMNHPEARNRTRLFSCLAAATLSMRYVDPRRAVEIAAPALQLAPIAPSAQARCLADRLRRECRPHLDDGEVGWLHDQLAALT